MRRLARRVDRLNPGVEPFDKQAPLRIREAPERVEQEPLLRGACPVAIFRGDRGKPLALVRLRAHAMTSRADTDRIDHR